MIFKQLKSLTVKVFAGANVVTAALMWLVGFSDCVNPVAHPTLSSLGLFFPILLLANLAFLVFWVFFRWRMVVIPFIGFLAAYVPIRTYIPINVRQEPPSDAIKVLSYNVEGYGGTVDGATNAADGIFAYVKQSEADIVCVQEAATTGNRGHLLLDSLYAYSYYQALGTLKRSSLAIYTRYPILRTESIGYASEGNGSIAFYLKVKGDTVVVVNNHLESTHLSYDERKRYKEMLKGEMETDTARAESRRLLGRLAESTKIRGPQADSVHAYVEGLLGRYPVIVCGDFNDSPISYAHRTIAKGLEDCYVSTGQGIGVSFNQKGFFVRIDNILCSPDLQPYACHVDNSVEYSDHYPIVCWLKKREKP